MRVRFLSVCPLQRPLSARCKRWLGGVVVDLVGSRYKIALHTICVQGRSANFQTQGATSNYGALFTV
jgi:hypothetical protein